MAHSPTALSHADGLVARGTALARAANPMRRTVVTVLSVCLATAFAAACGGTTSSPSGSGPDGGSPAAASGETPTSRDTPEKHRAAPVACPTDRPTFNTPVLVGGSCTKDTDCTSGKNGRCVGGIQPNTCSYDECAADHDCGGNSVCGCRNAARTGGPNVCFNGNCRTDADCNGTFCSPSAIDVSPDTCQGVKPGSFGYFCHTANDECTNDSDCAKPGDSCVLDADVAHWKCVHPLCTD